MNTKFKATKGQKDAANALVLAMAYTQTVRPIIKEIETDLFNKYRYKWDLEKVCGGQERQKRDIIEFTNRNGEYCKDESMAYLISDADFGHYLTEKHSKVIQSGFKVKFGYCPLLIAEDLERKARRLLIDEMEPITKLKYNDFFSSTKWAENMNKYIDLTMRLLSPYLKNPLANSL